MLLTFYFPIFDTRDFFPSRDLKTSKPVWPNVYRDRFVFQRNLGQIVARRLGGVRGWVAESDICEIRSSLKVVGLRPAFQRFFSDGWGGGYLSIGFDLSAGLRTAKALALASLIKDLAGAPLMSKHTDRTFTVATAGELVAELYARGTTIRSSTGKSACKPVADSGASESPGGSAQASTRQVLHAPPIVIVQGGDALIDKLFGKSRRTASRPDIAQPARFAYTRLPSRGGSLGTPVFGLAGSNSPTAKHSTRFARMVLARLYGELFAFELCLRMMSQSFDALDQSGLESLLARVDLAAKRLQGSNRPSVVDGPEDYVEFVDLFASQHDPGRADELQAMLDRLKLSANLKQAILRAARPYLEEDRRASVTNYTFNGPVAGAVGDNASASNFTQQNLTDLRADLIRMADRATSDGAATEAQVAAIEEARQAAASGDVAKAKSALEKLGEWGKTFATSVGANVAGAIIRGELGL